jgi:hypothetical protein
MIFIVKDEHNEQRDRVSVRFLHPKPLLTTKYLDDCQARHEHPHESAESEYRRQWRSRRRN